MTLQLHVPVLETKETYAKQWRDAELARTDILVAIPDHPQREDLLAYRIILRQWPSTDAFPSTRPTLGG